MSLGATGAGAYEVLQFADFRTPIRPGHNWRNPRDLHAQGTSMTREASREDVHSAAERAYKHLVGGPARQPLG